MDDLNVMERALLETVRRARAMHTAGDVAGTLRLLHTEAIPMLACYVQAVDVGTMYEPLTMPLGQNAEA